MRVLVKNTKKQFGVLFISLVVGILFSSTLISSQPVDPAFTPIVDGNVLASKGFLYEAYEKYTEAISKKPKSQMAYLSRAQVLFQMWEYKRAIEDFNIVLEINPNHTGALLDKGQCYAYLGEFDKAIENWNKVIELDPRVMPAYWYRGCVNHILGNSKYKQDYELILPYIRHDAYFYDKIASFLGLNMNPKYFNVDAAIEYSIMANDQTGWMDTELLYTTAECYFQKSRNRKTNKINSFYLDKAISIMNRIFDLQEWLRVEQNGYYTYRYWKMLEVRKQSTGK